MMKRTWGAGMAVAALACWTWSCSENPVGVGAEARSAPAGTGASATKPAREHLAAPFLEPADAGALGGPPAKGIFGIDASVLRTDRWVTRYDPARAWRGYNLLLLWRRIPALLDMNGNLVHLWPRLQAVGRARLTREGNLLFQDKEGSLRMVTWDGDPLWSYERGDADFSHHDVVQLQNGNVASIWRNTASTLDYIQEIDRAGGVAYTWKIDDFFRNVLKGKTDVPTDPTHVNSIQELPPNRHWDAGDARFRPGNLLVSARHLNQIFVVERATGNVVWRFGDGLVAQHEALMIEKGFPREGDIVVFNNGGNSLSAPMQSSVWVIDPARNRRTWEYTAKYFYSSGGGVAKPLPNGDFMIASSRGGRIFEVDGKGEIVWQMEPPYLPMRPSRYAPDFCPQLAALPAPAPREVEAAGMTGYVSRDLYDLFGRGEFERRRVDGVDYQVLTPTAGGKLAFRRGEDGAHEYCMDVVLPAEAALSIGYLLDTQSAGGENAVPVRVEFTVRLTDSDGGRHVLARDALDAAEKGERRPRKKNVDLGEVALKRGALCFVAKALAPCDDACLDRLALWLPPRIEKKWIIEMDYRGLFKRLGLAKQPMDRVLQEKLRALGYVE